MSPDHHSPSTTLDNAPSTSNQAGGSTVYNMLKQDAPLSESRTLFYPQTGRSFIRKQDALLSENRTLFYAKAGRSSIRKQDALLSENRTLLYPKAGRASIRKQDAHHPTKKQ
jgi:hypothetical protein